nr:PREDICTED: bromodomain-containing protein 4-like [Linepithema humile]
MSCHKFFDVDGGCEESQHTCVVTQVEDARHRRMDGSEDTPPLPLRLRGGTEDNREGRDEGGNSSSDTEGTIRGPKSEQGSDGDERMSDKTEKMSDKTDGSAIVICSQSDSDQGEKASSSVRRTVKKRPAIVQTSSEDEDTDSPSSHPPRRKKPGRPAKSKDQVGQHTAQKLRERKQLYKKERNLDLVLSIADGTEVVDRTTRRFRIHEKKMKECAKEFVTAPVQDVLNTLEEQVHAIINAASKGSGLQGSLQEILYTAASTLGAGAKALASRTEKGHYDPQAVVPPTGVSKKKGGKKGKKEEPKQRSAASRQPTAGPPPPPTEEKKDPSKKPGPPTPPGGVENTTAASSTVAPRQRELWTTVVKKGKKKPPSKEVGSKPVEECPSQSHIPMARGHGGFCDGQMDHPRHPALSTGMGRQARTRT